MKYWFLKKYKNLKITLIPELTRDINTYMVMPKHYKERYQAIKDSDINTLEEEDLRILLYWILNHKKIKNNKIIIIIDKLLEIPDTFLPATNYSLEEMLIETKELKRHYPTEEKLNSNNIAACYNCMQVFYIDKIKYVNKKGHCLCPYCKNSSLYFDNDFLPMDETFLRLARLVHGTTALGCSFGHIQKLLKKCIKVEREFPDLKDKAVILKANKKDSDLKDNHIAFYLEEISNKKDLTTKEEQEFYYTWNECFAILERNLTNKVIIDASIIGEHQYELNLLLCIFLLENLGQNPYLKEIIIVAKDKKDNLIYKNIISTLLNFDRK